MTDETKALVKYRIERAIEAMDEAKVLFDSGHINTYVNRLYYACFYAVSALLLSCDESTSKHGHLRSLFHKEFVKTGILPIESGKHFDLLFQNRQKGDYSDYITFRLTKFGIGWVRHGFLWTKSKIIYLKSTAFKST